MRLALQGLGIVRLTRLTVAGAIKRGELVSLLQRLFRRGTGADLRGISAPKTSGLQSDGVRRIHSRKVHAAAVGDLAAINDTDYLHAGVQ